MAWTCPSCVAKSRSSEISTKLKENWANHAYRKNQLKHKNNPAYKLHQRTQAKLRWCDKIYRSKLNTGIDVATFTLKSRELYGDKFDYTQTQFSDWRTKINVLCTVCDHMLIKLPQKHLEHGYCDYCGCTKGQMEILSYVQGLTDHCLMDVNDIIPPYELDIYLPTDRIGIEYHGLYWHSQGQQESQLQKMRHAYKADACETNNIKLLQFFDFEWGTKQEIVKSIISHALGKSNKKFNARSLTIHEVKNTLAVPFFEANHLYGHRYAKYIIALTDDTEVLAMMSFSKHKDGYEIIRLATKTGCSVRGGASRLLRHFTNSHQGNIYTYADRRFSTSEVYKKLGFTVLHVTRPNYFYSRNGLILSRQQCQKHKLKRLLPSFNSNLTESQNMFNNKFRRCWDAGHIKLVLTA